MNIKTAMNIKEAESHWKAMKFQAQNFAQKEQYVDALARLRSLKQEIQHFILLTSDVEEIERAASFLRVTERFEEEIQQDCDEWRSSIAAIRQASMDNAEHEMNQPLPNKA